MDEAKEIPVELNISPEKVFFIIVKAREFDAKVDPVEADPGSNPADAGEREVLEDYSDDATASELRAAIDALNQDEVIDLIALPWRRPKHRGAAARSKCRDQRSWWAGSRRTPFMTI
jgi:hypothetical protein